MGRFHRIFTVTLTLVVLTIGACDGGNNETQSLYRPTTSMMQTMNWILDYQADIIWGNSGWEYDADGEHELFPTNDAEWMELRNAAATIAETGNLLMMPGRIDGADGRGQDWLAYSQGIVDVGRQLITAAENQDKQAIFDLGGDLYRVCVACHTAYAYPQEQ